MKKNSSFNNNLKLFDSNIDKKDLDNNTLFNFNLENLSSNSLLTISNLSNFLLAIRNQYKEHIKQVKKEQKIKISILEFYSIEDFIRINQIDVNFNQITSNNS